MEGLRGESYLLVATVFLFALGCAHVPRATKDGRVSSFWSQISTRSYLRVRGIGAAPARRMSLTKRRGVSREAALADARMHLLAVIKGVKLESGVSISQLMERDSLIREIVSDVVRGGEEVETEWTKDGGCVTTLEIRRSRVERLIRKKTPREEELEGEVSDLEVKNRSLKMENDEAWRATSFRNRYNDLNDDSLPTFTEGVISALDIALYVPMKLLTWFFTDPVMVKRAEHEGAWTNEVARAR